MNEVTQVQKLRIYTLALFIMTVLMTGCGADPDAATPVLREEAPVEISVPTPASEKSVVYGRLINSFNNEPVTGVPFLSKNLSYQDLDMPATISFSLTSDPRAIYNAETGEFYFENVTPGENYVIVLSYGPGDIYVVRADENDYPRMIAVIAGESLDLGTIMVKEP